MQKVPLVVAASRRLLALDVMDHVAVDMDSPPLNVAALQESLCHILIFVLCIICFLSQQSRVARLSDKLQH